MRLKRLALAMALAAPLTVSGAYVSATEFSATYSGFEEVGALNAETGAIFSPGTATLDLNLDRNARTLTFKLTFSGLSAPVTQSHIHFGPRHVPGGVMVFFCTKSARPRKPLGQCDEEGTAFDRGLGRLSRRPCGDA
jgi:hypothetical protein